MLAGVLAALASAQLASGIDDPSGAFKALSHPFGQVLLGTPALGLVANSLWRLFQAITDPRAPRASLRGLDTWQAPSFMRPGLDQGDERRSGRYGPAHGRGRRLRAARPLGGPHQQAQITVQGIQSRQGGQCSRFRSMTDQRPGDAKLSVGMRAGEQRGARRAGKER
ncbi:MAG: DUF1206 domain-containing protein [Armatimonadetes bacterium]|nr:DUF1206 domain-containing protein [Armatimonadota bacterium]